MYKGDLSEISGEATLYDEGTSQEGDDMAKPNAKTLQERMGFTDPDLKTPGHDAIMMWLDEHMSQSLQGWLSLSGRSTAFTRWAWRKGCHGPRSKASKRH
jgi:hypothetical protein